jgi:hypothetical protein
MAERNYSTPTRQELERKVFLQQNMLQRLNTQVDQMEQLIGLYEEALEPLVTTCREWLDEKDGEAWHNRCNDPAEFLLWGKLIPTEGLGPRCYDHAAKHVGHNALYPNSGYALVDLRPARRLLG